MSAEGRLALLERMVAEGSTDPFHHYARAMELRSLGRLDEALAAYREVTERFPDYVPTYLMAGQVAQELGQPDEARRMLSEGVSRAGAAGDAHALSELRAALDALP
jgi:tetratricopeptide (TPR) repeat protein